MDVQTAIGAAVGAATRTPRVRHVMGWPVAAVGRAGSASIAVGKPARSEVVLVL